MPKINFLDFSEKVILMERKRQSSPVRTVQNLNNRPGAPFSYFKHFDFQIHCGREYPLTIWNYYLCKIDVRFGLWANPLSLNNLNQPWGEENNSVLCLFHPENSKPSQHLVPWWLTSEQNPTGQNRGALTSISIVYTIQPLMPLTFLNRKGCMSFILLPVMFHTPVHCFVQSVYKKRNSKGAPIDQAADQ